MDFSQPPQALNTTVINYFNYNYMDTQHISQLSNNLPITSKLRDHLYACTTWAKILSIVTLITSVISIITAFRVDDTPSIAAQFIILIVNIIMYIFLLRFSIKTQLALSNDDTAALTDGITDLKNYFLVYAILLIIIISLVVLFFLIAGLLAATK